MNSAVEFKDVDILFASVARDGRKVLDFYGGHAVAGLGYGHPRWLAALERQARQMAFQTNALPMLML